MRKLEQLSFFINTNIVFDIFHRIMLQNYQKFFNLSIAKCL